MNLLEDRYRSALAGRPTKTRIVKVKLRKKSQDELAKKLSTLVVCVTTQHAALHAVLATTNDLLTEMQGVNINIHPLRAVVLQKWRDLLAAQQKCLQEVVTLGEEQIKCRT